MLVDHSTGIRVLLAPPSPEMAELVTADHISTHRQRAARDARSGRHRHLGAPPGHHARLLRCVRHHPRGADPRDHEHQEHPPVPRAGRDARLLRGQGAAWSSTVRTPPTASGCRTWSTSIGRKIDHTVVSDGRTVVYALNRGVPFVVGSTPGAGQPGHRPASHGAWPGAPRWPQPAALPMQSRRAQEGHLPVASALGAYGG